VVSALLAQAGFTGPERVFEGGQGFYQAFAGGLDELLMDQLLESLGKVWEVESLTFKPYPCGSIAHPYMDCALRLRAEHTFLPDEIAEIHCRTAEGPMPRLWEPLAAKRRPPNGYAAKFSLPYLVAVMLVKGRAGLAEFTDEAVQDAAVLNLAAKVSYDLDPSIDYPRQFAGHVRISLKDGRVVEARQEHPRGGPDCPMTREDLETKFRGNAGLLMPKEKIEEIIRATSGMAALRQLTPLMITLRS
jgi:2-methylcitrate dehydratase PrpD